MRLGVGTEIPGINLVPTQLDDLDVLHLRLLLMVSFKLCIHRRKVLYGRTQVVDLRVLSLLPPGHLQALRAPVLHGRVVRGELFQRRRLLRRVQLLEHVTRGHPLIQPFIQLVVVDVVRHLARPGVRFGFHDLPHVFTAVEPRPGDHQGRYGDVLNTYSTPTVSTTARLSRRAPMRGISRTHLDVFRGNHPWCARALCLRRYLCTRRYYER